MGRKERRLKEARRVKERRSLEQKNKVKRVLTGTVCAGVLLSNVVTPASSVYANELDKTPTEHQVTEEQSPIEGMEETTATDTNVDESEASTEGREEAGTESTADEPEATAETETTLNSLTPMEDSTTEDNVSTRAIVTGTWGTAPVEFDTTTGTLTVNSGLIQDKITSIYLDNLNTI